MKSLPGPDGPVRVGRTTGGVLQVRADSEGGRAFGLGWGHARDRIVQLAVLRIAGAGRAAELLDDTPSMREQDRFIRSRGFRAAAERQGKTLTPRAAAIGEAYAAGINHWLSNAPRPLELLALRVKPEPWTVSDSVLIALLQSYLGLGQSQEVAERFIAHVGSSGHQPSIALVRALFAPHLDQWDPAVLRGVQLEPLDLAIDPLCASAFRAPLGSNAYALPPRLSRSGRALVAGEPHLDTTWTPPSFVEAVLLGPDTIQAGVTVPGVPGVLAGRWTHVAAAITYGFIDQIDLFVEEVKSGQVRRGDTWVPLHRTDELVRRKGGATGDTVVVWRSDLGILQGDPRGEEPKRVLALRWALDGQGMEDAFAVPFAMERAAHVEEARALLAAYPQSFQFALADTSGATGLQQCGRAPQRAPGHSGLDPQAGWDVTRHWRGWIPPSALWGRAQPDNATEPLVTANETTNPAGGPTVVTLGLSTDRRDRITQLLDGDQHDAASAASISQDRLSLWTSRALVLVRPHLPDNRQGRILAAWDCRFEPTSEAPSLFARFEATWLLEAYGDLFDRAHTVCAMPTEMATMAAGAHVDAPVLWSEANSVTTNVPAFRDALLDPKHVLFASRSWLETLQAALDAALREPARPWGSTNAVRRAWFLLAGNALGRSPLASKQVSLPGTMDTPEQGRIHRIAGRIATVAPVWRMVADLGEPVLRTALAGGPSDRLLSPRRTCDLPRFESYTLKELPLQFNE